MSTWQPGQPVVTEADREAWEAWRREQKREGQRWRRARCPRIDYYPTPELHALIHGLCTGREGGDLSGVLNRIVGEWAEHCHRNTLR